MPRISQSKPFPTTRTTRSTFKPTATSFLVAAPLIDSDSDSEDDVDFSFHTESNTYSDDDQDAVIDDEEVSKWCVLPSRCHRV